MLWRLRLILTRYRIWREVDSAPCGEYDALHWTGGDMSGCTVDGCDGERCLVWEQQKELYVQRCEEEGIPPWGWRR